MLTSKENLLNFSNLLSRHDEEILFWKGLRKEEGAFGLDMGVDSVRMDRINQKKEEQEEEEEEEDVPSQILHLETLPSSLSLPDNNQTTLNNFLNSLIDQAFWLYDQANPSSSFTSPSFNTNINTTSSSSSSSTSSSTPSPNQFQQSKSKSKSKGRKILIHCRDGYTETSLLALVYLSISNRQGIASSYLTLHNLNPSASLEEGEGGRSFFVYEKDMKLLKDLEILLESRLKLRDEINWKLNLEVALAEAGGESSVGMGRSDSGFVDGVTVPPFVLPSSSSLNSAELSVGREGGAGGEGNELLTEELVEKWFENEWKLSESERIFKKSNIRDHPWYFSENWEGSFPSKILDGLVSIIKILLLILWFD